jgi:hypothetical protein
MSTFTRRSSRFSLQQIVAIRLDLSNDCVARQLSLETLPRKTTKGPIDLVLDETRYRIWYRGAMRLNLRLGGEIPY